MGILLSIYLTMSTHQGHYQYICLPLVLPQQVMNRVLPGKPQLIPYIDDILVMGVNEVEHLLDLVQVFNTYTGNTLYE